MDIAMVEILGDKWLESQLFLTYVTVRLPRHDLHHDHLQKAKATIGGKFPRSAVV